MVSAVEVAGGQGNGGGGFVGGRGDRGWYASAVQLLPIQRVGECRRIY